MAQNPSYFQDFFKSLRRRRAWKIFLGVLRRSLLGLVVLLFLTYFLLQLPAVQNWLVVRGTEYLSKELNTKVAIKEFDFRFFDELLIRELYIEDLQGDTLLFAETLETSMSANLLALISRRLDLDDITLRNAEVNLNIAQGETRSNLQRLLFPSITSDTTIVEKKKPFFLDVQSINLDNVAFKNINYPRGFHQYYNVTDGRIEVEKIDLEKMSFVIRSIAIKAPDVLMELHPQNLIEELAVESGGMSPDESIPQPFIQVHRLDLSNGKYALNNHRWGPLYEPADTIMNFRFLRAADISLLVDSIKMEEGVFNCVLEKMAFQERSGFELSELSAENLVVDDRSVSFFDCSLITPQSSLGDSIVFKFREWTDLETFDNKVLMDARLKNSKVALDDIMAFAPGLFNNAFFTRNRKKQFGISGRISGRVNNLRGKNVQLRLDDETQLAGNFSSRNLTVKNEEVLNLELDRFKSNIQTLRLLVPNFNLPANFDKLGDLEFNGRFDGFFADFVAYGALKTDLGEAELDMRMDLREGRQDARYSGNLSLKDFDLGVWSSNPQLGLVSLQSKVEDGYGLTLDNVNTALTATVDDFSFKNYNYRNAKLNGRFSKNLFDGILSIEDENVDFDFAGNIIFGDTIPVFDFNAQVDKIDFKALNLTKQNFVFSGDVELNIVDTDIAKLRGVAEGKNLLLITPAADTLSLDSISLFTALSAAGIRDLKFDSEILKANIAGKYVLDEIPQAIASYLLKNYPSISKRLKIQDPGPGLPATYFSYDVRVPDSKNFLNLLDPQIGRVKDFIFDGEFDSRSNIFDANIEVPRFTYANFDLREILFALEGKQDKGDIYIEVGESTINTLELEPVTLRGEINKDTLNFQLNALSWTSILDNLQLQGSLEVTDEYFKLNLLPGKLVVLREAWQIGPDNQLLFDKGFVEVQNFALRNGNRTFELESEGEKGLRASVKRFDFSIIDEYWDYDKLDFNGRFDVDLTLGNLYELKDLSLALNSDTLIVNGEDWGVLRLDARGESIKDPTDVYLSITNKEAQLTAEGRIIPPKKTRSNPNNTIPTLDFDLTANRYPLHILEYWLSNGISNTKGKFDLVTKLDGPLNKPNMNGDIRIYEAATTIDFLKTRYFIDDERAKLTNTFIDATGGVVRDEFDNVALVTGGITHDHIKNMGLNATMTTDNFLALNTEKGDNDLFYGTAFAGGFVNFTGSFRQPNIFINAAPRTGTEIIIPITEDQEASAVDFIEFVSKQDSSELNGEGISELLGVEMDMRLAMNDAAEMFLVFDEKTGDIIQGRGDGDIKINLYRNGSFEMNGNYTISSGQYLFTALNIVNKPFQVREGGLIKWTGDPYNAEINIAAEYSQVRASPLTLISEYPLDPNTENEARRLVDIDLVMNLTGQLLQPDINFELSFPDVSPDVRSYVESKLRSISQDQNELNRQVFGLLVLGAFLPSTQAGPIGPSGIDIGVNTLTELLSSQLSLLLTDLVSDALRDGGKLSGLQLDVDYSQYNGTAIDNPGLNGSEFGLRPKFLFFDDRLTVDVGGGVNFAGATGTFFGNDVIVEFAISQDRRLKARAYQKYDNNFLGNRNKFGLGITYRREGDTIGELFSSRKKQRKIDQAKKEEAEPIIKGN